MFNKFQGQVCQGTFVHVTDRGKYKPVITAVALLQEVWRLYAKEFKWLDPPYEYEYEKNPFDIIAGNDWLRPAIEDLRHLDRIESQFADECRPFMAERQAILLY